MTIAAWIPSSASLQICEQMFPDSLLKADQGSFTYSTINDFGKKIHELLVCQPQEGFSSHYFANLKEIAILEGFEVKASESIYSVRDPKLKACDASILTPNYSESLLQALERRSKRSEYLKNHAAVLTYHDSINCRYLGTVALHQLHLRTEDGISKSDLRGSRLYFEGGNCMHLTNRANTAQFLVGEDLGVITHQTLSRDQWFGPQEWAKITTSYLKEMHILTKQADEITGKFLNGKIPDEIKISADQLSNILSEDQIEKVLQEMNKMSLLTVLRFKTAEQKAKGRELACDYLAQQDFVRTKVFPIELKCQADQVKFLPQIAYHLDIAMAPGPKGSIFLLDHQKSVELLQTIQANTQAFDLSKSDLEQLQSFIHTTKNIGQDLKPLIDETKTLLANAGYRVIPTPGAFFSLKGTHTVDINFLNCLTGFSDKTGHFYYIAPGAQTEGKLAKVLMDCYVQFLKANCNNIAVYFAGSDPQNPSDFTEAMFDINNYRVGPHCLSFELSTSSHTTTVT